MVDDQHSSGARYERIRFVESLGSLRMCPQGPFYPGMAAETGGAGSPASLGGSLLAFDTCLSSE